MTVQDLDVYDGRPLTGVGCFSFPVVHASSKRDVDQGYVYTKAFHHRLIADVRKRMRVRALDIRWQRAKSRNEIVEYR